MTAEIGLTGNVGAGKSTVARMLARRGAVIIDADALARRATEERDTLARIEAAFGPDLVKEGTLDRAALARRVFEDAEARARLEAIVHPRVDTLRREAAARARLRTPAPVLIVHDVPLLFETGLGAAFDLVVFVDAPLEVRVARVARRSGWEPAEIRRRDAAQMSARRKRTSADVVLWNGGGEAALAARVTQVWPRLRAACGAGRTARG